MGETITSPFIASTIKVSLFSSSFKTAPTPTTAGSSNDLAIIDECAVFPPISVTKAKTLSKFICAVSEGFNSFATIIVSGSNLERSATCIFITPYSHLFPISLKSPALSLKYASSKFASIVAYSSIASFKANSAVHFFCEILESISENNSSSSNKVICPSKISALSFPNFFKVFSLISSN